MIHTVYSIDASTLLSKPETGMGYQIVEASLFRKTGVKRYIVYNSELAIDLDDEFPYYQRKIIAEGFSNAVTKANDTIMLETSSIKVLSKNAIKESKFLNENKKLNKKRHSGGKGAIDNPKEKADGNEVFVRLSAYEDDRRIDFGKKKLKPGSYTTTEQDYKDCVSTNDDPVDRYALPNDEKIQWAFYIKPKKEDTLQRGIVQPAFGHEGGGIEAYFENGTSDNTFLQKKSYGQ